MCVCLCVLLQQLVLIMGRDQTAEFNIFIRTTTSAASVTLLSSETCQLACLIVSSFYELMQSRGVRRPSVFLSVCPSVHL